MKTKIPNPTTLQLILLQRFKRYNRGLLNVQYFNLHPNTKPLILLLNEANQNLLASGTPRHLIIETLDLIAWEWLQHHIK